MCSWSVPFANSRMRRRRGKSSDREGMSHFGLGGRLELVIEIFAALSVSLLSVSLKCFVGLTVSPILPTGFRSFRGVLSRLRYVSQDRVPEAAWDNRFPAGSAGRWMTAGGMVERLTIPTTCHLDPCDTTRSNAAQLTAGDLTHLSGAAGLIRMTALGELLHELGSEGGQVLRVAARDKALVADDLLSGRPACPARRSRERRRSRPCSPGACRRRRNHPE